MPCTYNGTEYSEGAVVCQGSRLMQCSSGVWEDTGFDCEELPKAPSVASDYHLMHNLVDAQGKRVTTNPADNINVAAQVGQDCLRFFAASLGKVGIRNNCDQCKKAVVAWSPNEPHVSKYTVQAYSQIIITLEDQTGQLIGEDPC